jgi:hypothetical protein
VKNYKGVMIAIPNYSGEIAQETHASITVLARFLEKHGIPSSEYLLSMAGPAEARNHIITRFYDDTDYEHLLMVDDDMQFLPTMIARSLNFGKPVIGAVYHKRANARSRQSVGRDRRHAGRRRAGNRRRFPEMEIRRGGVLLIHRSVVTEMLKKMPNCRTRRNRHATPRPA